MASSKDGNQASFGSKRSRNDVSRKDGDWTCASCGNLNFSFRTVCNRGHCGAPRTPVTPAVQVTSPYRNDHPHFYYGGVAAPPPMYGMPSSFGSPIPHSGLQYDYGLYPRPRVSYSPVQSFPPGSFGGIAYSPRPKINPYGYGFQVPPPWDAGLMTDNYASRKRRGGPDGLSEGDWICPKCDNINFAFRTNCNMKHCGAARPGQSQANTSIPEGSWTCKQCGNLNYPFRSVCNRKDCGSEKTASAN
ncbi:ranBP2-type zinc finger protein At1g67325-like isoform X2 [Cicer arietinum]|uniref:RanBP2-type zinc finger protein At1g67325-like n=1 Tax=Cicer arietinum TaxID=3827 RepID=A0A1S2Z5C6_CICAR|nr:ranBP2-type zinc finger protein At1g67325-like [Cicer arietinum]